MYTVPLLVACVTLPRLLPSSFGRSLIVLSSDGKSVDVMTLIQIKSTLVIGSTWSRIIDNRQLILILTKRK